MSYIDLKGDGDDSEYKDILAAKIHKNIINKIKGNIGVRNQIEFLFYNDPYYICDNYKDKREPEIFENINIFDLEKKEDIEYFQNIDLENIYDKSFENYLSIIIGKINSKKEFISTIKITKIKN